MGVGVWVSVSWWAERCDGFKYARETFSTDFFDYVADPAEKVSFSTGSPCRKTQSKKVESKKI